MPALKPSPETVNVRLLFTSDIRSRLVKLSRSIASLSVSGFVLGMHLPPHVTLFSFALDGSAPHVEPRIFSLTFTGLGSLGAGRGRLWVTAEVRLTPGLAAFREELIAECGSPRLSRKKFHPHVTLANIRKADFGKVTAAVSAASVLQASHVPCKLGRIVLP